MIVRAKFKVYQIEQDGFGNTHTITLYPVTSGSKENEEFYMYTPGGKIVLSTINTRAAKQFELGKEFYIDFIPA